MRDVRTGGAIAAMALLAGGLLVWIAMRNTGLYPVVLDDEFIYSIDSRRKPLADAIRPAYLFLATFRVTRLCGDDFLGCARLLNLAFFAGGAWFVAMCARRVVSLRTAAWIGVLTIASPLDSYTAYFMPEAMYFFGFWLLAWVALGLRADSGWPRWTAIGLGIGLLGLVKPHGLFLVPALVVYGAVVVGVGPRPRTLRAACVLLIPAVAVVTKFAVGVAIAGPAALTWFGTSYNGMANGMESRADHARIASDFASSLAGHGLVLAFVFAIPAAMMPTIWRARRRADEASARWKVCLLAVCVLACLVPVASAFTALIAGAGPHETAARLHMRYYDFALPLLLIVGAMTSGDAPSRPIVDRAAIAVLALVVLYAGFAGFEPYTPSVTDAPMVFGMANMTATRRVFGILSVGLLAILLARPRHAPALFVLVLVPWLFWKTDARIDQQLASRRVADRFDRAGEAAKSQLGAMQIADLRVVVDEPAGASRVLFQLDDPRATSVRIEPGEAVTAAAWPRSIEWLLVVGDHPIDEHGVERRDFGAFFLARRASGRPEPTGAK